MKTTSTTGINAAFDALCFLEHKYTVSKAVMPSSDLRVTPVLFQVLSVQSLVVSVIKAGWDSVG